MQPVELCNAAVGITSGSGSISDDVAKKMAKMIVCWVTGVKDGVS